MNETIVQIEELEKTFFHDGGSLTIFRGLSLEIERGKSTVICGKSGSGKSTLLNIIAGLDSATGGRVLVNGCHVQGLKGRDMIEYRRKTLGLVFQFHHLLKDFTALENIYLPSYMAGTPRKQAEEKALSLLEEVGLSDRAGHLPSQLSGGERQRIAVARSLVNDPELILADEPTGSLDPENAEQTGRLLFDMSRKHGKTLVLVTHDPTVASLGDRILTLEKGTIA